MNIKKKNQSMPKLFIAGLLLFCLPTNTLRAQNIEKTKQIIKSYTATSDKCLSIENKFGKVHVNTTDSREIKVEITMIAKASTESRAQTILDALDVEINEGSPINPMAPISFKTTIDDLNMSNNRFEVNYLVSIPKNITFNLVNKFGDIYMADHTGNLTLESGYGNLIAKSISGKAYIEVGYGSATIAYCNQGTIKIKYSNMTMENCSDITLENSFSNSTIREARNIVVDNKYSKLNIGKIGSLEGNSAYSGIKIGSLSNNFNMIIKYNDDVEINQIAEGFKSININGQFSNCDLQFVSNNSYDFDVNIKYGRFEFDRTRMNITKEMKSDSDCTYSGSCGGSTGGKVSIISKYGDVSFR